MPIDVETEQRLLTLAERRGPEDPGYRVLAPEELLALLDTITTLRQRAVSAERDAESWRKLAYTAVKSAEESYERAEQTCKDIADRYPTVPSSNLERRAGARECELAMRVLRKGASNDEQRATETQAPAQ